MKYILFIYSIYLLTQTLTISIEIPSINNPINIITSIEKDLVTNANSLKTISTDLDNVFSRLNNMTSDFNIILKLSDDLRKNMNVFEEITNYSFKLNNIFGSLNLDKNLLLIEKLKFIDINSTKIDNVFTMVESFKNFDNINLESYIQKLFKIQEIISKLINFENFEKIQNLFDKFYTDNFEELTKRFLFLLDKLTSDVSLEYGINLFDNVNETSYYIFNVIETNNVFDTINFILDYYTLISTVLFCWFFSIFAVLFLNIIVIIMLYKKKTF